jgi:DNA-binding CsgD family transcriptional regulator
MADIEAIILLRIRDRLSLREIGARVGVSKERVRQLLVKHGVNFDPDNYLRDASARKQTILEMYHQGHTQIEIASQLGYRSHTPVGKVLREAGLSRRNDLRIRNEAIVRLRKEGLSYQLIIERLGISRIVIYRVLNRAGVTRPLQCCQQVNAEIVRLREDGLTYKGIAQQLEVSVAKVGATLSRAGCVVRPKRTRSTLTI